MTIGDISVCPICGAVHVERVFDGWSVGCDCEFLRPFIRDDMGRAFKAFADNRRSVSECPCPKGCMECSNAPDCRPEKCIYMRERRWSRRQG